MTGLGRTTSKAFGLGAPKIPWINLGRTRGSKPQMEGTTSDSFQINLGDGFATAGNAKTKGVKPSMTSIVCPFFRAGALESIGDSMISSITTKVRGASVPILGQTLQRRSCKYSSQFFLDPIDITLWLVFAYVLGGHKLATMQSLFCTTSLSTQMIPQSDRL